MSEAEVLLTIRAGAELFALIERALKAREGVSYEQLMAAFDRADQAEQNWQEANEDMSSEASAKEEAREP